MDNEGLLLKEEEVSVKGELKSVTAYFEEYLEGLGDGSRNLLGVATGFERLDRLLLGLDGVIVLAGSPGVGKTSFALQIACYACQRANTPVLCYSLEMPRRDIFTKIFSRLSGIRYQDILLKGKCYLSEECYKGKDEEKKLEQAMKIEKLMLAKEEFKLFKDKLYVRTYEDTVKMDFETLRSDIGLIQGKDGEGVKPMVIIDHLQLFDSENKYRDQIDKENQLMGKFKETNIETGVPILLISQKNKGGFKNSDMESVKGSVDIVYCADVVMSLEGEEKENEQKRVERKGCETSDEIPKKLKLVISKSRKSRTGIIGFDFIGGYSKFEEA